MSEKKAAMCEDECVRHVGFFDSYPEQGVFLPRVEVIPWHEVPEEAVPEVIRRALGFEAGVAVCSSLGGAKKGRPVLTAVDESGIAWQMEGPVFPDHVGTALDMAEAVAMARTEKSFQRFRVGLFLPPELGGEKNVGEILRILVPSLRLRTRGNWASCGWTGRGGMPCPRSSRRRCLKRCRIPPGGGGHSKKRRPAMRKSAKPRLSQRMAIRQVRVLGWIVYDEEAGALDPGFLRTQWPVPVNPSNFAEIKDRVPIRVAHEARISSDVFRSLRPFVTVVDEDGFTWRFGGEVATRFFPPAMKLIAAVTSARCGQDVRTFHVDVGLPEDLEADLSEDESALQYMIGNLGTCYDLSISVSRPHVGGFIMNYLNREVVEKQVQERFAAEGIE